MFIAHTRRLSGEVLTGFSSESKSALRGEEKEADQGLYGRQGVFHTWARLAGFEPPTSTGRERAPGISSHLAQTGQGEEGGMGLRASNIRHEPHATLIPSAQIWEASSQTSEANCDKESDSIVKVSLSLLNVSIR